MAELFAAIAAVVGLLLWWLKKRGGTGDSPKIKHAKRIISRSRANIRKIRWHLQNRDLDELEKDMDAQERDMDALRSLYEKSNSSDE